MSQSRVVGQDKPQRGEVFLGQSDSTDALFVLGAGASIGDGAPLQKDILHGVYTSFDKPTEENEGVAKVLSFISKNFDVSEGVYPSLEAVFGYLDHFINTSTSLGQNWKRLDFYSLRETLIAMIHQEISQKTKGTGENYRKFWEVIDKTNRNISIITLNYDTLLDEAFDSLYPDRGYIDYSIDLMNYHHVHLIDPFHWWIDPREPITYNQQWDPKAIKILKVHGSLNWKYCDCCNQVLLTAWDTPIDPVSISFISEGYGSCGDESPLDTVYTCPLDGNIFSTFIAPPSHIKNLTNPILSQLSLEAGKEIRKAKKLIFVGYSFPEADVHMKALFKTNLRPDVEVHVFDPYLSEEVKRNYKSLSSNVRFHSDSFENLINGRLSELIKPELD